MNIMEHIVLHNNNIELQCKHLESFNTIKPILDDMKADRGKYKEYLGWYDLSSPIFSNPDILFVGINHGPGRYKEKGERAIFEEEFSTPWRSELEFTKHGVTREGNWWDNTSKHKNLFPKTICELLVRVYRPFYPTISREKMTSIFNERVMATNLYPMATEDKAKLDKLIREYTSVHQDTDIKGLCNSHFFNLIELVSPKIIIVLGKTMVGELVPRLEEKGLCHFIIDRTWGWHGKHNISRVSETIRNKLSDNCQQEIRDRND